MDGVLFAQSTYIFGQAFEGRYQNRMGVLSLLGYDTVLVRMSVLYSTKI